MWRWAAALVLAASACAQVNDPVFSTVPFARWTEQGQTRMRWRPQIVSLGLSNHQRLMFRIEMRMDGAEAVKRRGTGEMLTLVEIKDAAGRVYQTHGSLNLSAMTEDASRSDLEYAQDLFLKPGDYQAALAVYATTTGEYAIARHRLRVDPIPRDPLPEAGRDLPAVEFIRDGETPDAWYLPSVSGRLHLPVESRRRVDIDLVVNATPSEQTPSGRGGRRSQRQILSVLLPAMKTLAQLKPALGSVRVAMLDLSRRAVLYDSSSGVEWIALKTALGGANSNMIDVGSLAKRRENAQFFVKEIARRLENARSSEALHALVVLSAPMAFEKGEDLRPIETSAGPSSEIFYVRYWPAATTVVTGPMGPMGGRRGGGFPRGALVPPPEDSLEKTLKPLDPKLYDVKSPLEFRKAIAEMIVEMERASH